MSGTVDGKAAIDLAFIAYDNGRKSALAEPQRLRVQAAMGIAVDITVHGPLTPRILRHTATLLLAQADILDDPAESGAKGSEPSCDEGNLPPDAINPSPQPRIAPDPEPSGAGEP